MRNRSFLCVCDFVFLSSSAEAQPFSYYAAGRLLSFVSANGNGLQYSYDSADNLVTVTNISLPTPPVAITAVRSGTETRLEWQSNATGITEFVIMRRAGNAGAWQQIA